jgi:hypothetical protein
MDRVEIVVSGVNGEDKFLETSSSSQIEKKCLDFRVSVQLQLFGIHHARGKYGMDPSYCCYHYCRRLGN